MPITWRGASREIVDLLPDPFHGVEFRSTGREFIHMQPWVVSQKVFDLPALVDGVTIPHQHQRAGIIVQQRLQKGHHLFAAQGAPPRVHDQLDLARAWTDTQRSDQVEPLMMGQAGADGWRFSPRRPTVFQRRQQGKTALIDDDQLGAQATALFLSAARRIDASGRRRHHPVQLTAVEPSDNSSPSGVTHARHRWRDTGWQTTAKSAARPDPRSSSRRRNPVQMRLALVRTLGVSGGQPLTARADLAGTASGAMIGAASASVESCAQSRQQLLRHPRASDLGSITSWLAHDGRQAVQLFLLGACG